MALVISGTERQTISLGGVEFKNVGGGGKVALEPLFTGLITGEAAYFEPGPYKFSVPSDLRDTDRIYFTWPAFVHSSAVVIDAGNNAPGVSFLSLTSKPCVKTVADLRTGIKIYGTDMFSSATNFHNRYITVKISESTLTMTYLNTGTDLYGHTLIGNAAPNGNYPIISIGPFYKIL